MENQTFKLEKYTMNNAHGLSENNCRLFGCGFNDFGPCDRYLLKKFKQSWYTRCNYCEIESSVESRVFIKINEQIEKNGKENCREN